MHFLLILLFACSISVGCSFAPIPQTTTRFSDADARAFYRQYEHALKAHRGDTLAQFYHPDGALLVLNGTRIRQTHAGIDSVYRSSWRGPVFFAFDSLHFEPLNSAQVLVTGRFRWLNAQSPDTGNYAYLSILDRTAAGLRIRVEHETQLPNARRP